MVRCLAPNGREYYEAQREEPAKLRGWLGESNGVARWAEGAVLVTWAGADMVRVRSAAARNRRAA